MGGTHSLSTNIGSICIIVAYFFNFEGKTSGIKNLQLDIALTSIDIEPYPIEKQVSIAHCLRAFDKKITLNRLINHNLPTPVHSSGVAVARRVA